MIDGKKKNWWGRSSIIKGIEAVGNWKSNKICSWPIRLSKGLPFKDAPSRYSVRKRSSIGAEVTKIRNGQASRTIMVWTRITLARRIWWKRKEQAWEIV